MSKTGEEVREEVERVVDVIVLRFTSLRGQFMAPGLQRMRLSDAKHMQAQGLARPPKKRVDAVLAVPPQDEPTEESEDAEGIDPEDKGEGSGDE